MTIILTLALARPAHLRGIHRNLVLMDAIAVHCDGVCDPLWIGMASPDTLILEAKFEREGSFVDADEASMWACGRLFGNSCDWHFNSMSVESFTPDEPEPEDTQRDMEQHSDRPFGGASNL